MGHQATRNFPMDTDLGAIHAEVLIRDRVGRFTDTFDTVLADAGLHVLKGPFSAPKASAHCERILGHDGTVLGPDLVHLFLRLLVGRGRVQVGDGGVDGCSQMDRAAGGHHDQHASLDSGQQRGGLLLRVQFR